MIGGAVRRCRLVHHARWHQGRAIRLLFERAFADIGDFIVVIEQGHFIGIDMPAAGTSHLRRQRGAGEAVVEVAELAIKQVRVRVGAFKCGGKIVEAGGDHGADRVFLRVGIEIAEQQHIRITRRRQHGARNPAEQTVGLGEARRVETALAIAGIGITAGAGTALGTQMIDDHGEALAKRRIAGVDDIVGLRRRRAIVDAIKIGQRRADRRQHAGTINLLHANRIGAECAAGVDECIRIGATTACVDRTEQVGDGRAGRGVFKFGQTEHIGIDPADHDRQTFTLTIEFGDAVGTAAIERAAGAAGAAVAAGGGVEGGEVIQQVHARCLDRSTDSWRCCRPRIGDGECGRIGRRRTQPPCRHASARHIPMQHTGQAIDHVAAAEEIRALGADRKTTIGARMEHILQAIGRTWRCRCRQVPLLCIVVVIKNNATTREVVLMRGHTGNTGCVELGELLRPTTLVQGHLAIAAEVEILRDRQRVDEAHLHAFACFVVIIDIAGDRQIDRHRADLREVVAAIGHHHGAGRAGVDPGHAVDFRNQSTGAHTLAFGDCGGTNAARNEDAFRRLRIGIGIGAFFLQKETAQLIAALQVADDDALDGDRAAGDGCRCAIALDVVDQGEVVVDDGADALTIGDDGIGRVGHIDDEVLVGLRRGVAIDQHGERIRRTAGGNGLAGQRVLRVIAGLGSGAIGRGDVERHAARTCGCRQADREAETGRAGIAFVERDIVDREVRRSVVVDDRAQALAIGHRRAGGIADVGEKRFVGLGQGVANDQHGERIRRAAGGNGLAGQRILRVVGGLDGSAVGSRDIERHAAGTSRCRQADGERVRGRAGIALVQRHIIDGEIRQWDAGIRRQREVVDREAIVGVARISIGPADPEGSAIGDGQRGNRRRQRGPIGRHVAVLGADGGVDGRDEIERGDIGPRAGHQVGGIEAVFEVDLVGTPRRAQPPLFAGVGHVQSADRGAGVVGVAGAEVRDHRAAAQAAECTVCGRRRAVTVGIAGIAAAGIDAVLLVVTRAAAGLGHEPTGDGQVVGRTACRVRQRVEILRRRRTQGGQADALCRRHRRSQHGCERKAGPRGNTVENIHDQPQRQDARPDAQRPTMNIAMILRPLGARAAARHRRLRVPKAGRAL